MSEERPLTEFSSTDRNADDGETEPVDSEPTGERTETTEPVAITYRWQSEGSNCAQCGASTEKQWLDDSEFVCPDCKSWE